MKFVVWVLRIIVFIALFGLAIKNSGPVDLRFFFDQMFTAPLSFVILATFVLGVLIGVTAAAVTMMGQRREIARLRQSGAGESQTSVTP